ncbi:MAG TPA: hypothetical protein PK069_00095 [Methanolinea sp.]|nr:hypothetical protein [Methanolinea sp.]HQK55195.1 hypothetical protein [Methanolinea sp.]
MDLISLAGFLALVIVGIAVVLFLIRIVWSLVPAAIVALGVYLVTSSLWWTGVAFLTVVVLTFLYKLLAK